MMYEYPWIRVTSKGAIGGALENAEVRELYGREQISQLFHFDVHIVSKDAMSHAELIGCDITIVCENRKNPKKAGVVVREIGGIITGARDRMMGQSFAQEYIIEVAPKLWLTSLTKVTDVYQEMNAVEIIEKILKAEPYTSSVGEDVIFRCDKGAYPKREFVVQYQESHLSFISRLCEHYGIFFFFENADGKEKLVFADANAHFRDANPAKAQYMERNETTHMFDVGVTVRHKTRNFRVRDYNYRKPKVEPAADRLFGQGIEGVQDEFGAHVLTPAEAEAIAKVRTQEVASDFMTFDGQSEYSGFRAGSKITVEDHPSSLVTGGPLVITEVVHRAVQVIAGGQGGHGTDREYHNDFRAISAGINYRAPRLTPKPVVPGLVTAIRRARQQRRRNARRHRQDRSLPFELPLRLAPQRPVEGARAGQSFVAGAHGAADGGQRPTFSLAAQARDRGGCRMHQRRPRSTGHRRRGARLGRKVGRGVCGLSGSRGKQRKADLQDEHQRAVDRRHRGKPRWRTQVGNAAHVHLLGEPEHEQGVKRIFPKRATGSPARITSPPR